MPNQIKVNLEVKNLKVVVEKKEILKGVSLSIRPGKVHALMGPNGSGKSTLASTIMGHPGYAIASGALLVNGRRINKLSPDERAKAGIFLSFQYPVEVPGLSIKNFLRVAYNNVFPKEKLSIVEFNRMFESNLKLLHVSHDFGDRYLNEGFSGGEKKKLEILQMAVLRPPIVIMDEADSGLDIDALKTVAQGVNAVMKKNPKMSVLVITHYNRILRYIKPDYVHILINGRIVSSGRKDLALRVERRGYDWLSKIHE